MMSKVLVGFLHVYLILPVGSHVLLSVVRHGRRFLTIWPESGHWDLILYERIIVEIA